MLGFWNTKKLEIGEDLLKIFPEITFITSSRQLLETDSKELILLTDCVDKTQLTQLLKDRDSSTGKTSILQIADTYDKGALTYVNQFVYWNKNFDLNKFILQSSVHSLQNPSTLFFSCPSMKQLELDITSSERRQEYSQQVIDFVKQFSTSSALHKKIAMACEELLTNVIYDAALEADPANAQRFKRSKKIELKPAESSKLVASCSEDYLTLTTIDPWASFKKEKFIHYSNKIHHPNDVNLLDTKENGAGLGLFRILNVGSGMACKVTPNKQTEFSLLLEVKPPKTNPDIFSKSLAFYNQ